jgi:hypothetical protein
MRAVRAEGCRHVPWDAQVPVVHGGRERGLHPVDRLLDRDPLDHVGECCAGRVDQPGLLGVAALDELRHVLAGARLDHRPVLDHQRGLERALVELRRPGDVDGRRCLVQDLEARFAQLRGRPGDHVLVREVLTDGVGLDLGARLEQRRTAA